MKQTVRSRNREDYQYLAQPVAAMALDYPAGHETQAHNHPRAQLIYTRSGVMQVITEGGTWVLPPQRALWVPGGVTHAARMMSAVQLRTLYVRAEVLELPCEPTLVEVSGLLRELIYALLDEPVDYAEGSRGDLIAALLLHEIRALKGRAVQLPMPHDPRLLRLCEQLRAQPDSSATLEDWAEQIGASARTLARLFQRETQMSFRQWRQQLRLAEALTLLAQGRPVGRVAAHLGYRSQSAFTAMFQRALGCEPSRYFS